MTPGADSDGQGHATATPCRGLCHRWEETSQGRQQEPGPVPLAFGWDGQQGLVGEVVPPGLASFLLMGLV